MSAQVDETLEKAAIAAASADWPQTLTGLLAAWTQVRTPPLVSLIKAVGAKIDTGFAQMAPKAKAARESAWHTLAAARDPNTVGCLLKEPWPRRWKIAAARVAALKLFKPDPRISAACMALIDDNPYSTDSARDFWPLVFRLLVKQADPTIVEAYLALEDELQCRVRTSHSDLFLLAIGHDLKAATARVKTQLTPEQGAACDALRVQLAEPITPQHAVDPEQLLAAIYATPDDDAARLVYGDYLAMQEDPRGEFIAMQFAPAPSGAIQRGIKSLLKTHRDSWVPKSLSGIVDAPTAEFSRGFLSACTLRPRAVPALIASTADPAWATVESIVFARHGYSSWDGPQGMEISNFLSAPSMRSLTAVHGIPPRHLRGMSTARCGVRRLSFVDDLPQSDWPLTHLVELGLCSFLRSSRSRSARDTETLDAIFGELLGFESVRRLEVLNVGLPMDALAYWLDALTDWPGALRRLTIVDDRAWYPDVAKGWRLDLLRGPNGAFDTVRALWRGPPSASDDKAAISRALAATPRGRITQIEVVPSKAFDKNDVLAQEVAAVAAWAEAAGVKAAQ